MGLSCDRRCARDLDSPPLLVIDREASALEAEARGHGSGPVAFASGLATHLIALAVAVATVVLAGQPIYANDTWIHLALGEVFSAQGPLLASDPHLFAAPGPPSPSSWLGSVAIWKIFEWSGFVGLRAAHAAGVAGILLLAHGLLRRAGARPALASAGLVAFAALSTYRLVQLRPDLFTIGAVLLLHPLILAAPRGPDAKRVALAALLSAVWANVHAAFLLGPLLVAAASAGAGLAANGRARALRLALAATAMSVASLANPEGIRAHLAYFASGRSTLGLEAIADEWNPTNLFAWPVPGLPPTFAAWLVCWLCVVGTLAAAAFCVRERWRPGERVEPLVDPALVAVAAAGLAAAIQASRFLWLGIFALALIGGLVSQSSRPRKTRDGTTTGAEGPGAARSGDPAPRAVLAIGGALAALALAVLHFQLGDWPLVSRAMRADGADYATPYPAERFNTHAIWFLADTGAEGRIFNDYPIGGFMSFWLAPRLRMASSGTMNVEKSAMQANFAIGARQQLRPDESYAALLDRQGLDLFLGQGYPIEATPGRPIPCTIRHLEHEPGWLLVFRNLRSAVYLRKNARNAPNLDRIAAYYAKAGVPFDPDRGFDPEEVLRRATPWAYANGLIPYDFEALVQAVRESSRAGRVDIQTHRLAVLYATLGLYERALRLDRSIQRQTPDDSTSAWRVLWSLAQLGRWEEALAFASAFERRSDGSAAGASPWSTTLARIRDADPGVRATLVAHLPMLRPEHLDWVRNGVAISLPRLDRTPAAP